MHTSLYQVWNICACGPEHVLREIAFAKPHPCIQPMRTVLEQQGWRATEANWRDLTKCRQHVALMYFWNQ